MCGRASAAQAVSGTGTSCWRFSAVAALLCLAGSTVAQDCDGDGVQDLQQTFRWQAIGSGFWGSQENWQSTTNGIPVASSLALFDGAANLGQQPYSAFLDGFTSVRGLGILSAESLFDLGGSTLSVGGSSADCREFRLGGDAGATLTVTGGGQFRVNRAVLADKPKTSAKLILDGQNNPMEMRHLSLAPMIVGQRGEGIIELQDAQFVHYGPLTLGSEEGSSGLLTGFGMSDLLLSAEVASHVAIGFAGEGVLRIEADSMLNSNGPFALRLGSRVTGVGEVCFFGLSQPQSFVVSDFEIGSQGTGRLRVEQGSSVSAFITSRASIGLDTGSFGSANITGFSNLLLGGQPFDIGPGGRADLGIGEGSSVDVALGTLAFVDGVVRGSGLLKGGLSLIGGEIQPSDEYAETTDRQILRIDGNLEFSGVNPATGQFETGRMVYTLASPDPQASMSALVDGSVALDGTLRVRIRPDVRPELNRKYPIIESGGMTGTFDAVQTPVIEQAAIAVPTYSGDGDAFVEFLDFGVADSVLGLSQNLSVAGDTVDAVVADIDADGFPDLITLASNGAGQDGEIRVSFNQGIGSAGDWLGFTQGSLLFSSLGSFPKSLAIGDMNGDLLPDLVVMNTGPTAGQVRIRLNSLSQPGDFSEVDARAISVNGEPADIALADISGNGLLDVITVFSRSTRGTGDGGVQVSENEGDGFDDSEGDTGDDPGSVDTMGGEYMPSGVAVSSKGRDSMYLYDAGVASRGPVFPLFLLQEVPAGRDPDAIYTADLTGDGLDDVIASDSESGTISVLVAQNFGEIIYDDAISLNAGETSFSARPGSVVVLDVNDDGRRDLVFTARDAEGQIGVRTILNLGMGDMGERLFSESLPLSGSDGGTPRVLRVADLDQDGEDDLIVVRAPSTGATVSSFIVPGPQACNAADLSVPLGVLDLADINAFVGGFTSQSPIADLAAPFGVFDLSDISAFSTAFLNGCP